MARARAMSVHKNGKAVKYPTLSLGLQVFTPLLLSPCRNDNATDTRTPTESGATREQEDYARRRYRLGVCYRFSPLAGGAVK